MVFLSPLLFVIDEEWVTMVIEPLQHEQPAQPQHQLKTSLIDIKIGLFEG